MRSLRFMPLASGEMGQSATAKPSPGGRGRGPPRSGGRVRDYKAHRRTPSPYPLPMGEGDIAPASHRPA
ncbi:hypothetical protein CSW60_15105 [Caulobacter sp. X]|nr:hypothetical protein CSW60_15105 [Caulobacter sp. X]